VGRPSDFTQELADLICQTMAEGNSLRAVCREKGMPAVSTVCRWLAEKPAFQEQYARARESMADTMFEELLEIADDSSGDYTDTPNGQKFNGENVQRSRLRVDARKWAISKIAPKKYGDKLDIDAKVDAALTVNVIRYANNKPAE